MKLSAAFIALSLAGSAVALSVPAADAAPSKFSSCPVLNGTYPGGVAKNGSVRNTKTVRGKRVSADSQYRPTVSAALYKANKGLDRDKDGIACER